MSVAPLNLPQHPVASQFYLDAGLHSKIFHAKRAFLGLGGFDWLQSSLS
jgi:hypothetical protein